MSKAVMTIHGFLTNTNDFGRLGDYLTMYYDEVKHCEIPGHNGKINFSSFTVKSTVDAVLSCYDELKKKHDTVDVVGFSMGGALATYLCARREIGKAVFISPANKFFNLACPFESVKFYVRLLCKRAPSSDDGTNVKRRSFGKTFSPYADNLRVSMKVATDYTLKYFSLHTFHVFSNLIKMADDVLESVGEIAVPSLIMRGTLDELVPISSVEFVKKHFVNLEIKSYEGVGHAMLYTNRDCEIIPDIIRFLTDGREVEVPFMEKSPKRKRNTRK